MYGFIPEMPTTLVVDVERHPTATVATGRVRRRRRRRAWQLRVERWFNGRRRPLTPKPAPGTAKPSRVASRT